jgi:hypothetical protein
MQAFFDTIAHAFEAIGVHPVLGETRRQARRVAGGALEITGTNRL